MAKRKDKADEAQDTPGADALAELAQADELVCVVPATVREPGAKLMPRNPLVAEGTEWRGWACRDSWAQIVVLGMTDFEKRLIAVCALRTSGRESRVQRVLFERKGSDVYLRGDALYHLAGLTGLKQKVAGMVERLIDIGALLPVGPHAAEGEALEVNEKVLICLIRQAGIK